jgi:Lrp/AsnC family leucine-responsive transcriptional regulator
MTTLDRADRALLAAVQKNNRLTSEELAQIVNLSPTACQ